MCRSTTSQASRSQLKFSGPVLADIFLGKITKWNDPAIAKLNEGVSLPGTDITVVHRSDGSGTTYIWVDYLAKVSPEWKQKVGVEHLGELAGRPWRKGQRAASPGLVKQTPGAIGYVELIYAIQNKISYGAVQNAAGKFITASTESVTAAAAEAAKKMPPDFRVSITNAPGDGAYPISSFTWLLLYETPQDKALGKVDGRLHELGADRWAEVRGRSRLRAASAGGRRPRKESAAEDQAVDGDCTTASPVPTNCFFRIGTGAFALLLIADRCGDRVRAGTPVVAVDSEVRLAVLADRRLGPGRRASSARARSSGARCIRRSWRC